MVTTIARWTAALRQPGAAVFAVMFSLESLARAVIAIVIPLQAFEILHQDARGVSLLYFGAAFGGFALSFAVPALVRRFRRRWVYTMGAGCLILAALLLATGTLLGQGLGMMVRAFGAASLGITFNLYVMDHIRPRAMVRSEPLRMMFSAIPWVVGPPLGVYLHQEVGVGAAEGLSAAVAAATIGYFWYLRLSENPAVAAATRPPPDPLTAIRRFFSQPRLRLAWTIAVARSSWWSMFFVYPPIYLVASGKDQIWGAMLVSAGNALLLLTPIAGMVARRVGLRRPIILALAGCAATTMLAGVVFDWPWAVSGLLMLAALAAVALDGLGNIPFLRSVRPLERPQMTMVFRTYIDVAEMIPAAIYSLLLGFFDLDAVFIATGLWLAAVAFIARRLPRRF
jgi:MFS family permease